MKYSVAAEKTRHYSINCTYILCEYFYKLFIDIFTNILWIGYYVVFLILYIHIYILYKSRSEFEVAKFASDFAIVGVSTMECHEALPLSLQIHL